MFLIFSSLMFNKHSTQNYDAEKASVRRIITLLLFL